MTTSGSHSSGQVAATGPLRVSAANPRYFTAAAGDTAGQKAVYLTGSHIWNNLHDGMGPAPQPGTRSRRGPPVPRRQQHQRDRDRLHG
jgi:hypothetical protein